MTELTEIVQEARQQAVVVHGKAVLDKQFDHDIAVKRAADPDDPTTDEVVAVFADTVTEAKAALGKIARQNGTTAAKAVALATDAHLEGLKGCIVGWTNEMLITQDMLDHPDAYGHKLLDGSPMPSPEQLQANVSGFRHAIAQANETLGVDPEPKKPRGRKT